MHREKARDPCKVAANEQSAAGRAELSPRTSSLTALVDVEPAERQSVMSVDSQGSWLCSSATKLPGSKVHSALLKNGKAPSRMELSRASSAALWENASRANAAAALLPQWQPCCRTADAVKTAVLSAAAAAAAATAA